MLKFLGRSAGLAFLALGIALTFTIAIGLILIQLLGGQAFIDDLACRLDLSTDCIRDELALERQRLDAEREELEAAQSRFDELEAMYDRLARLEHATESFALFYMDSNGPLTVVTGHRYASLIEPGRFVDGWCYTQVVGPSGAETHLDLAVIDRHGAVTNLDLPDAALRVAAVTHAELDAARTRCQWPEGLA